MNTTYNTYRCLLHAKDFGVTLPVLKKEYASLYKACFSDASDDVVEDIANAYKYANAEYELVSLHRECGMPHTRICLHGCCRCALASHMPPAPHTPEGLRVLRHLRIKFACKELNVSHSELQALDTSVYNMLASGVFPLPNALMLSKI